MSERSLDSHEALGCKYCNPDFEDKDAEIIRCEEEDSSSLWFCNRPKGHDKEHAICTFKKHPLKIWANEN